MHLFILILVKRSIYYSNIIIKLKIIQMRTILHHQGTYIFDVDLKKFDTFGDVKQKITEKYGIILQHLIGVLDGKWISDDTILSSLKVDPASKIVMSKEYYNEKMVRIEFENMPKLNTMMFYINPFIFIEEIKFNIQDITGIPFEKIKFFVEGQELLDKKALFEYGFPEIFVINAFIDE